MNARKMILLAAAALLASRASAEGTDSGSKQQPPSDRSEKTWYQKDAQKAGELGRKGVDATKRGASAAGKKVNEGGQAITSKVVGTKTVSGRIVDVSQDRVTLKRSDGKPMELRLTGSTKVTVGGQKGSAGSLHEGDEVRASYAQSGGAATAMKIDAKRKASRPPASGSHTGTSAGSSDRGAAPGTAK